MGSPEVDNHEGNALIYNFFHLQMEVIFISYKKDYTGQQFGDFKVVEMLWNYQNKHHTYCKCIGIDNKEYIIRQDALVSGATKTIHGACSSGIKHDITGQRFGRLVAIEPINDRASNGGIRWKCICDCGNYVYPTMNNLKRGHTTSCGCAKEDFINSCKDDIVGNKYGLLTVIKYVPSNRRRMVESKCDCGNTIICDACSLTTGHTMSCGCMNQSKGEMFIREILDELNIEYVTQKRFEDCKNKRKLPELFV